MDVDGLSNGGRNDGLTSARPTFDRVVELLNNASLMQRTDEKLVNLKMVEELVLHKEPNLLDNFFDEMTAFQTDRAPDVRKYIIQFMEEACKVDGELHNRVVGNLSVMMADEHVAVLKRVLLGLAQVFKTSLLWMIKCCKSSSSMVASVPVVTDSQRKTWVTLTQLKKQITDLIDSDNDGVRTHAIKFLEAVIITLSFKQPDSVIPAANEGDPCLNDIPPTHPLLKVKKLEDEGNEAFDALAKYQSSAHISSVNLMMSMSCMTNIVRQRPVFMSRVVPSFESLHVNLPPTLSKSQVSSVRKNLKMQMLSLLRLPASADYQSNITTLLTDLGATQSEVLKNMPQVSEVRKRKGTDGLSGDAKKSKVDLGDTPSLPLIDDDDDDDIVGLPPPSALPLPSSSSPASSSRPIKSSCSQAGDVMGEPTPPPPPPKPLSAVDITAEDLVPRMTPQNVADLVLLSMVMLPDIMPAQFQATYTPIAAAGTPVQIKHMARLLATQLTAAGLGKGVQEMQAAAAAQAAVSQQTVDQSEPVEEDESSKQSITVLGGSSSASVQPSSSVVTAPPPLHPPTVTVHGQVQATRKGIVPFSLASVTKRLSRDVTDKMAVEAMHRVLDRNVPANGAVTIVRAKLLTTLVAQFGGQLREELLQYIFADLRNRSELAIAWMYQEYALYQGFNVVTAAGVTTGAARQERASRTSYDTCLTRLLEGLLDRPDQREGLFNRLMTEAPCITPSALAILKRYCQEETRIYLGIMTLKELIIKRPCMKLEFLDIMLDFTSHDKSEVRTNAIRATKKLHEREDLRDAIEKYAKLRIELLLLPNPPPEITRSSTAKTSEGSVGWTEESIKLCLHLYLGLLPIQHKLIHDLARVYTAALPDIKRTILRILETPVKGMGMDSPEFLLLVEDCPKGAETLVTRVIHILTDRAIPSPELVDRVRELYKKRVSDVRFLIPVLNGLTKSEVLSTLPKLIDLNPIVVKEVFNRLLGVNSQVVDFKSPVTPAELLIALHSLDVNKVELKIVIKACTLCFAEKQIYTVEVLGTVIQSLMEMSPLPTLLMRTVIQSLALYPELRGFVMSVMQRLANKQVWKNKKVWEGFVKCCFRTKPQSFQIVLQLPAPQFKDVFVICPELREPLLAHVQAFTPLQRASITKSIMSVLERGDDDDDVRAVERAKRTEEDRLAQQEQLYEKKLEDDRRKHSEKKNKQEKSSSIHRSSSSSSAAITVKSEVIEGDDDDESFFRGNHPLSKSHQDEMTSSKIPTTTQLKDNNSTRRSSSSSHHS